MAGQQSTHVLPLGDDLAALLDDLRGFLPEFDAIADAVESLATRTLTIPQTQTALTMIAGSTEEPGQQIDLSAMFAALIVHLTSPANLALRTLPAHVQAAAAASGRAFADHDADFTPRTDLAKTIYTLNPI